MKMDKAAQVKELLDRLGSVRQQKRSCEKQAASTRKELISLAIVSDRIEKEERVILAQIEDL